MRFSWPRSLQARLAIRLGVLFLIVTVLAVAVLAWLSASTAESLSRRDLFRLADELADAVEEDRLDEELDELLARGLMNEATLFAVRDGTGALLAASGEAAGALALSRSLPGRRPASFRLAGFGEPAREYFGVELRERSEIGPLSVLVAEPADEQDALLGALLREIGLQAAWIIPLFIGLALLVGVYAIRSGLRPLRETAEEAALIRPETMSRRLKAGNLPSEVWPFIQAVNRALDRLEEGFDLQRRFTANAAHELRTPLAIITGALEALPGDEKLAALRRDVARMNRLVEQLLHVARLDSVALDTQGAVDLRACARRVVEYMAPVAIEKGREIALADGGTAVRVKGNAHAIEDAIRNLVENAIAHAPAGSEVEVRVDAGGSVSVRDGGPGLGPEERERVFERFWRGKDPQAGGAGLGLAIVREIMALHGGSVEIDSPQQGGARFTLRFPAD